MLRRFEGWFGPTGDHNTATDVRGVADWDSGHDTNVLDSRTAAVLALGEQVLREAREKKPAMSPDEICRTHTAYVATWANDPVLLAAMNADVLSTTEVSHG